MTYVITFRSGKRETVEADSFKLEGDSAAFYKQTTLVAAASMEVVSSIKEKPPS